MVVRYILMANNKEDKGNDKREIEREKQRKGTNLPVDSILRVIPR